MIENPAYWERVRKRAEALGTDGCSKVPQWNKDCCLNHDIQYRTGMDIDGNPITRVEADFLFWECNRLRSAFSILSPRSWIRWAGVRIHNHLTKT